MNPNPAEQWCRDQALRFSNRIPDGPIEEAWLPDPRFLRRAVNNPVSRPAGARSPHWFDVRDTAEGSSIANALGANSGYFQEYAGWAPTVSWLFDATAALVDLSAHPDLSKPVRDLLLPYIYTFVEVTEAVHDQLSLQQIHAKHKGTGLEGSWRAIQAEIRLADRNQRLVTSSVHGTLDRLRKELLTQEIKFATKSAASRRTNPAQPTGAGSLNSGRGSKPSRGQSTAPKPST